jgi:hypothetical protein
MKELMRIVREKINNEIVSKESFWFISSELKKNKKVLKKVEKMLQ